MIEKKTAHMAIVKELMREGTKCVEDILEEVDLTKQQVQFSLRNLCNEKRIVVVKEAKRKKWYEATDLIDYVDPVEESEATQVKEIKIETSYTERKILNIVSGGHHSLNLIWKHNNFYIKRAAFNRAIEQMVFRNLLRVDDDKVDLVAISPNQILTKRWAPGLINE